MKLGIVDDHQIVIEAYKTILRNHNEITIEANNGKDFLDQLTSIPQDKIPEIALIDITMPIMDGYSLLENLSLKYPQIRPIIITMHNDDQSILRMIKLGAKSYLSKTALPEEIIHTIEMVANAGVYYNSNVQRVMFNSMISKGGASDGPILINSLTEKEIKFLRLLCSEKNYKEIALELKISPRTVDGYRDSLFTKFNVKTRIGLVLKAIKMGIA